MVRIDYDSNGFAQYIGWALPATADTAATWRICHPIFSGTLLLDTQWADGDDQFDNVWSNRAILTYISGDFALEAALDLVPTGSRPGTVFNATTALTARNHELFLNGMRLKLLTSGPGLNEYTISGSTITTGSSIATDDYLVVRVRV